MKIFLNKIRISFVNSSKGLENFSVVSWGWGGLFYLMSYFIFNKLVIAIDSKFFDYLLITLLTIYFVWHIYVSIKCFPKTTKLSKEEKEQLKIQNGGASKAFLRKFFLQEPITKKNGRNILIAIDILILLHFYALIQ